MPERVYGLLSGGSRFHILREGSFPPRFLCGRQFSVARMIGWEPEWQETCYLCRSFAKAIDRDEAVKARGRSLADVP